MNFKTSVVLSVVLIVVLAGFWGLRANEKNRVKPERPSSPTAKLEQPLFEQPPEDLVKVTCTRAGEPAWRFERSDSGEKKKNPTAQWRLTEPIDAKVPTYLVDGIVNRIKNLKYEVKYGPGDADTLTAAQAGLDPAKVTIEMKQRDGTTLAVQIGKPASVNETFARPVGVEDIYVVKASLDTLLKKRVEEYRDKAMFAFDAKDAVSIEITQRPEKGEPVHYRLVKRERDGWVFEAPFNADAQDKAVDNAIKAMARLRAGDWVDSGASPHLGRYGLSDPRTEVDVLCEKKITVPVETDESDESKKSKSSKTDSSEQEAAKPKTTEKIESHRYSLLIADRSPLGKKTSVYAKLKDSPAVATISKTTADTITPSITKWRNMKICRNPVAGATRIAIRQTGGQAAAFVKDEQGNWIFEDRKDKAEGTALKGLIDKIGSLKAVAFVDKADARDPKFGLTRPSVAIEITVPGSETPEQIAVGNPTDPNGKRLYYVRYGNATSIAKVRAADVVPLKRDLLAYENRTITDVPAESLKSIDLNRTNHITGASEAFTLEREGGDSWRLTAPVNAETDPLTTKAMVTALTNLKAESVVSRSEPASDFGFDKPAIGIAITYEEKPVPEANTSDKAGEADSEKQGEGGEEGKEKATQAPPAPKLKMFLVSIAERNHKVYAIRSDRPIVYQLSRSVYDTFQADYHVKKVWELEQSQISAVTITSGDASYRFEDTDKGWVYAAEPDLPIDGKKVTNLTLQIQDLKLERFVAYGATDLSRFGLDKPSKKVAVETRDGKKVTLLVSGKPCPGDTGGNLCAVIEGTTDVFLLTRDTVSRFDINMADFEKSSNS